MNELLIYKVAFDNIARIIKQWDNDEEAEQADFEYLMEIENVINAVGVLPNNATNGDMIKAMFSSWEIDMEDAEDEEYPVVTCWIDKANNIWTSFDLAWWNTPYKGGIT